MKVALVTLVARALYEWCPDGVTWDQLQQQQRDTYRDQARYLLRRFKIVTR